MFIPESLLNLQLLAYCDIALALIAIIFQITAFAVNPYYDPSGGGIWCGITFTITAGLAIKTVSVNGTGNAIVSVTLIMGTLSFACGFLLLGFNAAAIDHIKHRYSDYCSTQHSDCSTMIGLASVLLVCGLFAIPLNALLTLAAIKIYKPASTINPPNTISA